MADVTIGFVPRERFSRAAESLERLFKYTRIPFNLVVVDCNIPRHYWAQMENVLKGHRNVQVLRHNHYLLPNQSKNLVLSAAHDEYVCMFENDVLVGEDWLTLLQTACEEYPAEVAVPLILEGRPGSSQVHFDDLLGTVQKVQTKEGERFEILPKSQPSQKDRGSHRQTVQFMEQHLLLFRRSVFDRIGLYDEELNTRDEIDLSLALHEANVRVVFEPNCEVFYEPPYPPNVDELDYFFMKWGLSRAELSRERIREKWNLTQTPGDMNFVKDRNLIGSLHQIKGELRELVHDKESFVLVDQNAWSSVDVLEGLRWIPFLEKEGVYWGAPPDDETAISEIERLRQTGAKFLIFAWNTFWWLDYYSDFSRHLRSKYRCVLDNERMIVFDLRVFTETAVPTSLAG